MENIIELDNLYFVIENVLEFTATFVIVLTNEFLDYLNSLLYEVY